LTGTLPHTASDQLIRDLCAHWERIIPGSTAPLLEACLRAKMPSIDRARETFEAISSMAPGNTTLCFLETSGRPSNLGDSILKKYLTEKDNERIKALETLIEGAFSSITHIPPSDLAKLNEATWKEFLISKMFPNLTKESIPLTHLLRYVPERVMAPFSKKMAAFEDQVTTAIKDYATTLIGEEKFDEMQQALGDNRFEDWIKQQKDRFRTRITTFFRRTLEDLERSILKELPAESRPLLEIIGGIDLGEKPSLFLLNSEKNQTILIQ
jgi:hypothetical protein